MRQATDSDFIIPEFRGKKAEDYEVRDDGVCVRKDRWENGIHSIRFAIDDNAQGEFEILEIVKSVRDIVKKANDTRKNVETLIHEIECNEDGLNSSELGLFINNRLNEIFDI